MLGEQLPAHQHEARRAEAALKRAALDERLSAPRRARRPPSGCSIVPTSAPSTNAARYRQPGDRQPVDQHRAAAAQALARSSRARRANRARCSSSTRVLVRFDLRASPASPFSVKRIVRVTRGISWHRAPRGRRIHRFRECSCGGLGPPYAIRGDKGVGTRAHDPPRRCAITHLPSLHAAPPEWRSIPVLERRAARGANCAVHHLGRQRQAS